MPAERGLLVARALVPIGEWIFLVWLLAAGWSLRGDVRDVGTVLAALLAPRAVVALRPRLALARGAVAAAGLATVTGIAMLLAALLAAGRLEWLGAAALAVGLASALAAWSSSPSVEHPSDALLQRGAMVLGPLLAAVLMLVGPLAAAGVAVVALLLAGAALSVWRPAPAGQPQLAGSDLAPGGGFRPLPRDRDAYFVLAALIIGLTVGALVAELPLIVARLAWPIAAVGAALALIGLGHWPSTSGGNLARLHLRLPPAAVILAGALVVAGAPSAIAFLSAGEHFGLLVPALVAVALLTIGLGTRVLDELQRLRLQRAGIQGVAGGRSLAAALAGGHLGGALLVAAFGDVLLGITVWIGLVALIGLAATLLSVWLDPRSRAARHFPTQKLSWETDPPARPHEPAPPVTRAARLEAWISGQVELETIDVTLPVSGRRYAIVRPQEASRERLFEAGRTDPDKQMPFWAKIWPSGVALADVVIERASEVRDSEVLELGAGLGVTACTALEEGARLTVADYSPLPLAMCRYNGLVNAGRAPRATCFNWRSEEQVADVLRRRPPIGLILAADVLYEGRDVMPLLRVIERLLAPGGALWLAEPVRKTAARFLDIAAAQGWQIDSRTITAPWPDATDGRVNVHVITRDSGPAPSALALAGWRA